VQYISTTDPFLAAASAKRTISFHVEIILLEEKFPTIIIKNDGAGYWENNNTVIDADQQQRQIHRKLFEPVYVIWQLTPAFL
jgi:hypothetical protein